MRTVPRALMRSTALAAEPPTNQPNREIFWLSAEQEAEADRLPLAVGKHTVRTGRRAMMRSTALAPKLSTDEPNREIFWLSAEQEAGGTPNRARTHSRADTDAVAQHKKAKRTLRACPRPWFESHAIPLPEEAILGCSRGRNRTI